MISGVPSSAFKVQPARLISKFSVLYSSIHSSFAEAIVPAQAISLITTLPVVLIFEFGFSIGDGEGEVFGVGDTSGDIFGITNGDGDTLGDIGDKLGDTFLSPLVSPLSPSPVTCGLPTSEVPRPSDTCPVPSELCSVWFGVVNSSIVNSS